MTQLEAMIPSNYVREFVDVTEYEIDDADKASMIYHNKFLRDTFKKKFLQEIHDSTDNKYLKAVLDAYLNQGKMDDAFEDRYFHVPNPYDRGDIVYIMGTNALGVIEQDESTETGDTYKDDYLDITCVDTSGTFVTQRHSVMYLEFANPESKSIPTPVGNLLKCASNLYKGFGTLESLIEAIEEWKEFIEYQGEVE